MSTQRDYAGQSAAQRSNERRGRYIEAGLELLGTVGLAGMTVRGVIREAGLAPRFFYDTFGTLEDLQVAVFEQVVREVEGISAVKILQAGPDLRARVRAGVHACVGILVDDPRKGRVLFVESAASPVLATMRHAETQRFADIFLALGADHIPEGLARQAAAADTARSVAQFAVGGLAEVISAAVEADAPNREAIVERLTELVLGAGETLQRLLERGASAG